MPLESAALKFLELLVITARYQSMSAFGQKRTYAPQKAMSALPLIASAKAGLRQIVMSALPPISGHVQCNASCLLWANSGHCCRIEIIRKCMVDRQDERKAASHR